jgi:hypothetical protein
MKAICDKLIADIILNPERLKSPPPSSETRKGLLFSSFLFNTVLEVARAIRQEKEIKESKTERKKKIYSEYDMTENGESSKESTKKLSKLINKFS